MTPSRSTRSLQNAATRCRSATVWRRAAATSCSSAAANASGWARFASDRTRTAAVDMSPSSTARRVSGICVRARAIWTFPRASPQAMRKRATIHDAHERCPSRSNRRRRSISERLRRRSISSCSHARWSSLNRSSTASRVGPREAPREGTQRPTAARSSFARSRSISFEHVFDSTPGY